MKKVYAIMFDSFNDVKKVFLEKNAFFGVEVYATEAKAKQMLDEIKKIYEKEQFFNEEETSFNVHVYYGIDLYFYIKKMDVIE